jgi:hypothetical protein
MPENAFLMIHDPSGLVMGTAAEMREMADTMDKIAGSMIRGYAGRSGRSEEEIAALMAAETWFDAEAAIAAGLATRMVEPIRIAASFNVAAFRNAPPVLIETTSVQTPVVDSEMVAAADNPDPSDGTEVDDHTADEYTPQDAPPVGADVPEPPGEPEPAFEPEQQPADLRDVEVQPSELLPCQAQGDAAPGAQAIRAEAITHARAVIDLCRLAGQPQMAGRFLEEDTGLDEVRTRLLTAKATATPEITSSAHAQPGRATTMNPWGEVIARTFKTKG